MAFRLTSADGTMDFELRPGTTLTVGRALSSDLPVLDPTISRRHAQLVVDARGAAVQDLDSSNGTFVNGERIERARLAPGDTVTFGKVRFHLSELGAGAPLAADDEPPPALEPTIVRMRPVPDASAALADVLGPAAPGATAAESAEEVSAAMTAERATDATRDRRKLALLLEVSKALTRAVDPDELLEMIARFLVQILDVDRVAVLLEDAHGELVPRLARDRAGEPLHSVVPQSIARRAMAEKVAILSENAPADRRFGGHSIVVQRVQAAICAPLVGSEQQVLGVLYVDNRASPHRLTDDDLEFLVAFSGIAAVAIENNRLAERVRRQALVRSNFERFFTPQMAARIAAAPDAITLGGERRSVAVLFADVRDFTALSARMRPDETARLLTEYFTEMVDCVFRHGGTLDKFMGDAVMAQWGAPISAPDDADRAMRAALDMLVALDRLNARWRAESRPALRIGIGLNFGEVFAGNIGSERRLEYTVIGDTVNTASRLCSWAEGGEILVSDACRAAFTTAFPLAERPPLALRGKPEPLTVWRADASAATATAR